MTEASLDRIKTIGWVVLIVTAGILINTLGIVKKVNAQTIDLHGAHPYQPAITQETLGTLRGRRASRGGVMVQSGRPAGCPPRAWCGCWLGHHLGMPRRDLWLARNWARVGSAAAGPAPGVIAVFSRGKRGGHVGIVVSVPGPGRIVLLSGNDGRAVRQRERSTAGVIAWRRV